MNVVGKLAFDAYKQSLVDCGAVASSAFTPWERLTPEFMRAWTAGANAVSDALLRWVPVVGDDAVLSDVDTVVLIACPAAAEQVWLGYLDADDCWLTVEGGYVEVSHWRELPAPANVPALAVG